MELLEETYQLVYEHVVANDWEWRFDGNKQRPSYEDVTILLDRMVEQVRKSPTPISIESGGILVKRTDEYVDVYVFAGGIK
jgi:hypothetical protein